MDVNPIIDYFYPQDDDLKRLLLRHSRQVCDKALALLDTIPPGRPAPDREVVRAGALLHDIGIRGCAAPDIFCTGDKPYLQHGIIGAQMLRDYGREHGTDLETYARVCERHTGAGLTAAEIRAGGLPLPEKDFLPETPEEKLICLADKFFSKSGKMQEKPLDKVRRSITKFGAEPAARLEAMLAMFVLVS